MGIGMWESIQYVSTGLTLVAFIVAITAGVIRSKSHQRVRLLEAVPEDQRAKLVERELEFFDVATGGLTKQQQFELALAQINARSRRFGTTAVAVCLVAILFAAVSAYAIQQARELRNLSKQVSIRLFRSGTTKDCPSLPVSARVKITLSSGAQLTETPVGVDCKALFAAEADDKPLTLALINAAPYQLAERNAVYQLGTGEWNVSIVDSSSPNLRVSLFSYSGQCTDSQKTFDVFARILRSKTLSLRGLFAYTEHRYDYLAGVAVVTVGRELSMNGNEVRSYLKETGSLQALSGICFGNRDGETMRSQIFSGALAGRLPDPLVVDLAVTEREFGATRDIHTASILYALAQEAESRRLGQDLVIGYLAQARDIASQIRTDARAPLMEAIEKSLRDSGAPSKMNL
jgi:hypothetical protein